MFLIRIYNVSVTYYIDKFQIDTNYRNVIAHYMKSHIGLIYRFSATLLQLAYLLSSNNFSIRYHSWNWTKFTVICEILSTTNFKFFFIDLPSVLSHFYQSNISVTLVCFTEFCNSFLPNNSVYEINLRSLKELISNSFH